MSDNLSTAARLVGVFDHLGLRRAHVAAMIPGDIGALAATTPDRLAGVVLCTPFFPAQALWSQRFRLTLCWREQDSNHRFRGRRPASA